MANDELTYFVDDAEEQIKKAIASRYKVPKNREQRRALMNKMGKEKYNEFMVISETAKKLNYIDLIQKFRELNEKKKNEVYEDEQATEN